MSSPRNSLESTPICRCRVLYLGSAVPHVTKDGLQGIQEPLRELYPEQGAIGARGIDSWLSVWSNGLLLENVDENHKKVTRFFPIDTLHYCAAVRYVLVPEKSSVSSSTQPRFLPLDSPFARSPNPSHPPLFAAILRRTTGIKVLECHTFICKREMAANALVRCCFHAYADSSYARHIDSGGGNTSSVYGTLRNYNQPMMTSTSIEKVEGWRRMTSPPATSGSTLTLDSTLQAPHLQNGDTLGSNPDNANSVDDISIYNGDENHKIWAGSTRDISGGDREIYGEYSGSTMRSTRSSRPRQVINAPPPPPPPVKEEKGKKNKDRTKRKKGGGSREEVYPPMNGSLMRAGTSQAMMNGMRSQSSMSGTMMKNATMGFPAYSNGTILRPASSQMINGYHPGHPPPPPPPVVMVPTTLPHPRRMVAGTFSHRPTKSGGVLLQPRPNILPPNFVPMPPHPVYLQTGRKPSKHYPVAMEEPIYMPSARPLSPVASYQPGHFPHEAYLMQQYATMDVKAKKKMKEGKHGKKSIPILINGERADEDDEEFNAEIYRRKVKEGKSGKKISHASNGDLRTDDDDDGDSPFNTGLYRRKGKNNKKTQDVNGNQDEDDEGESPFNTGIYRRKGHLNERAFSYSIRQEHRSRSYGSLANLKFAPPPMVPNGGPPPDSHYYGGSINKEEMKKEREIMQMMQDLELSGDELERSEVPAGVYQQSRQRPAKVRR